MLKISYNNGVEKSVLGPELLEPILDIDVDVSDAGNHIDNVAMSMSRDGLGVDITLFDKVRLRFMNFRTKCEARGFFERYFNAFEASTLV